MQNVWKICLHIVVSIYLYFFEVLLFEFLVEGIFLAASSTFSFIFWLSALSFWWPPLPSRSYIDMSLPSPWLQMLTERSLNSLIANMHASCARYWPYYDYNMDAYSTKCEQSVGLICMYN